MTRLLSLLLLSFACVAPASAAGSFDQDIPHISWSDAPQYYGQRCVVYGTVVLTKDIGSRTFLNFHEDYRKHFTVVINRELYDDFSEAPEQRYRGKHVRVAGEVIDFNGTPEIVLADGADIEIIDDPTPPAGGAARGAEAATPSPTPQPAKPTPARRSRVRADGVVRIATFNVLNLFDDHDDPYVENERLPGKDDAEVKLLAGNVRALDADVVAFQEVENRPFLQQFVDQHLGDLGYSDTVLIEGNNERGIDVGLISRLPVGPVTSYRHLDFKADNGEPMRFQRDLLRVHIMPPGHAAFDVYVVHLKSKYGGAEKSLPLRMGEARTIRKLLDERLKADPDALFVICGDFNDTIDSKPLQHLVGEGPQALKSFYEDLPSDKRITYNRNHLSMIDFIFASPAMGKLYQKNSYAVKLGTVESSGSDHNPVVAAFKLPAASSHN